MEIAAIEFKNLIVDTLLEMKKLEWELLKYQVSVKVFLKELAQRSKQQIIDVENRLKLLETTINFRGETFR